MLQIGKNITQSGDIMQKITIEQLYNWLINPKQDVYNMIQQLRIVRSLDADKYRKLKVQLPYFTAGIFNPAIRKTENFAWILYLVLDFDHLNEKGTNVEELKSKLINDNRIVLLFTSPGGDGLKVIFELSEKCFDAAKYSLFYKVFAKSFAIQYSIEQVVDTKTSDVTRACFMSIDEKAYFNRNAEKLIMKTFIDFDNYSDIKEAKAEVKLWEKNNIEDNTEEIEPEKTLTDDLLLDIKRKLNPNYKPPKKQVFVPEELENSMKNIQDFITLNLGLQIENVQNISWGKKLTIRLDQQRWAEINIFYGKKGFSVVKTTKTGSNKELADVIQEHLKQHLML
jgi:hypothetical protein